MEGPPNLHVRIVRAAGAFRNRPGDVAVRILDVAGLAVDAVLRIDLEPRRILTFLDPLIDARRAVTARWAGKDVVFRTLLQRFVLHLQMDRLILFVVGVGQEYGCQLVEGHDAIRLRIVDLLAVLGRLQRVGVLLAVFHRAEEGEAEQLVGPHVEAAERDADCGAELGPQRLGIAHAPQILADRTFAPGSVVVVQFVVCLTAADGRHDFLSRQHAGQHRVMRALDARHVDEACRTAHQQAAREGELRNGLEAAFGNGAGTIGNALAAFKGVADGRMGLEPLEFLERGQPGVLVVEVNDEADCHLIVFQVVEKRTAARLAVQRPAERMLHKAEPVFFRVDLPQFLDAYAELRHVAVLVEIEFLDELLGQGAAGTFADQCVLAAQLHATGEHGVGLAVPADTHVARRNPNHVAVVVIEDFGSSKARVDFNTEGFGLLGEPAADVAKRDDIVAVVVHEFRHEHVRQAHGASRPQNEEMVVGDRRLDRRVFFAPFRKQLVESDRVDHGTGENMRADFRPFFQYDDAQLFALVIGDLFQPDRGCQARRPGADDNDIHIHALAFAKRFLFAHLFLPPPKGQLLRRKVLNSVSQCLDNG
ncbi:hypothetical protein SIAM614_06528 [Stappia aggregata IAM 12614]|uniref:Uncharacterized protein n=1 Tax=Roseibium aggregatum (strain ATCC 25650 / DSM 13394 / JCM 20685 / NBRC 16684 / NCIMB 2208 / IAM 12614 / B1) TaxID=384765 RepID=A0NVF1_ROSAI|nr:hypothetical protein SIAM614_06528 [Stappia aggregata IAM 12614] [Roseibium aggregatum IAM 12614]